jgi:hypothetical protein
MGEQVLDVSVVSGEVGLFRDRGIVLLSLELSVKIDELIKISNGTTSGIFLD